MTISTMIKGRELSEFNRILLIALIADTFTLKELRDLTRQPEQDYSLCTYDDLTGIRLSIKKCSKAGFRRHVHVQVESPNLPTVQLRFSLKDFKERKESSLT